MRILALSNDSKDVGTKHWPNAKIVVPDWPIFDPPDTAGRYDMVIAHFVLQRVGHRHVPEVLKKWRRLIKKDGELRIHVPSAEWYARQVLAPDVMGVFALEHLFGLQLNEDTVHLTSFTMSRLRKDLADAKFIVADAQSYSYRTTIDAKEYVAEQHYIRGIKA